jgi:hypothetical protein
LKNGHKDKNGGEPKYPIREPTKFECLTYEPFRLCRQLCRCLRRILCEPNVEDGPSKGQIHVMLRDSKSLDESQNILRRSTAEKNQNIVTPCIIKRVMGGINSFFDRCDFRGVHLQPNEKSSPAAGDGHGGAQPKGTNEK